MLQSTHASCRLSMSSDPPLLTGFTWSIVASSSRSTLKHSGRAQKGPSRLIIAFLSPLFRHPFHLFLLRFGFLTPMSIH